MDISDALKKGEGLHLEFKASEKPTKSLFEAHSASAGADRGKKTESSATLPFVFEGYQSSLGFPPVACEA